MIATGRARILQATITRGTRRWWISITVEAADLHPAAQHPARDSDDTTGWVGVDRCLQALVVAGRRDGTETFRVQAPKILTTGLRRQRRLARAVSRKKRGSANRRKASARLAKHHVRVRDTRQHVLHQVSNQQQWRHGQVMVADRWFASSKTCSSCGTLRKDLTLKDRTYTCSTCGLVLDRDLNAAVNLAAWAEDHTPTVQNGVGRGEARVGDRQAAGLVNNACRRDGTGPHTRVSATSPDDAGTTVQTADAA